MVDSLLHLPQMDLSPACWGHNVLLNEADILSSHAAVRDIYNLYYPC